MIEPAYKRAAIGAFLIFLLICIVIPLVNLPNPPTPELTELGQIDTGGEAWDVDVEGDIAFVIDTYDTNPGGLVVIDVSDPEAPVKLSSYYDGGLPITLDAVGELVYVADHNDGLEIIEMSGIDSGT